LLYRFGMTRRRWIADETSGDRAFLLDKNAEHLSRVLRAQIGQQFEIATPEGVRIGTITAIRAERVEFSLAELADDRSTATQTATHLYLAIFKFDRLEWAIEKCAELGVSSIAPVFAKRTDTHLVSAARKRAERWRRIAHEAAQQSRRDAAPLIADPERLETAIAKADGSRIVLAEGEREQRLIDLLGSEENLSLAIGPEGGWAESELALFQSNGWKFASLGPTILRAETAAIAAVAIVQSRSG
jgi:16S rRNA (uracil1498-N3)-methyltransferase